MYELNDDQYRQIDYFRDINRYIPTERLLRHRRNVVAIGGFVLFFYFAGIDIQEFSGGFIRGTMKRPNMVSPFVGLFFIYNFYMFHTNLYKEKEKHNFTVTHLKSFGVNLARYIIKQHIGPIIIPYSTNPLAKEFEPQNLSTTGRGPHKNIEVSFSAGHKVTETEKQKIEALPGFKVEKNTINFSYALTDKDVDFFKDHKDLFRSVAKNEFMDFRFPEYFGAAVLLTIMVESVIVINNTLHLTHCLLN